MSKREDFKKKVMKLIEAELKGADNQLEVLECIAFAIGDAGGEIEKRAMKLAKETLRCVH